MPITINATNLKYRNGDGEYVNVNAVVGSGSGLPPVTSADNGKSPVVINGEWVVSNSVNDRFDELDVFLGSVETLTWQQKANYVRAGKAANIMPVGTQFTTYHATMGQIVWDVVAHDHFRKPGDLSAHTMTLLTHFVYGHNDWCLNAGRVLYAAENGLAAGSYKFECAGRVYVRDDNGKTFYFTIQNAIPAGGHISGYPANNTQTFDGATFAVFASADTNTPSEVITVSTTEIAGATDLGTTDGSGLLGYGGVVECGMTDYDACDMRQWLNSDADIGEWWEQKTRFNTVGFDYTNATHNARQFMLTQAGFLHNLDPTFLSFVGEVDYPCISNAVYSVTHNTATAYTVRDKFVIPSTNEINLPTQVTQPDTNGTVLDYYHSGDAMTRIKYRSVSDLEGSAYFTRTTDNRPTANGGLVYGCSGQGKLVMYS